jgi:hypothetical protein
MRRADSRQSHREIGASLLWTRVFLKNGSRTASSLGPAVNRANHTWVAPSAALPRSYLQAVEGLALKCGWRIEQNGPRFHLRAIEPETFRAGKSTHATPSNHLAFFNSLGELHEFLVENQPPHER